MYWSFKYQGKTYFSWGQPRALQEHEYSDLQPRYDVPIYSGQPISPGESVLFNMQGTSDLGLGDSIWLVNFMRDIYNIKARRRCDFYFASSEWTHNFYGHFLPSSFKNIPQYVEESFFRSFDHMLPSMYYWHDTFDDVDRSWVDDRSLLERLYYWTGMEYNGLADWGDFTDEKVLYPDNDFYEQLNLNPDDKYVYFQWHSSGHTKNLPPKSNIKLLRHITERYGYKVYVVGRLKSIDDIESIPGVKCLSGKTEGNAEALFTLAFNSEFIVSPDSAGVHLAEAYKIPAVCILSSLPPVYIASKYQIPTFMFGSGKCPYKPCGIVHELPKANKCPSDTGKYCKVLEEIDLNLFDKCIAKSFDNRARYRSIPNENFYEALECPISLR